MNKIPHQQEKAFDEFCQEIVQAARASEEEIEAAANAPFLFQRLRAQIAAEQQPIASDSTAQNQKSGWFSSLYKFQRHWTLAAAALLLLFFAFAGERWLSRPQSVPVAGNPLSTVSPISTPEPVGQSGVTTTPPVDNSKNIATNTESAKASPASANRAARKNLLRTNKLSQTTATAVEESEVASEFMPLTYTANRESDGGQIVRVEMPRSVLLTLGLPLGAPLTGERVKADVMIGDDGVALAIRIVQ